MFTIRDVQTADYHALAAIASLIRTEPVFADEMQEGDEQMLADKESIFRRLVAEADRGQVLGYAFMERMPWMPEGRWSVYACTHPDHRGKGVGSALLEASIGFARENGATWFQAYMRSDDDYSYQWVQRRGFEQDLLRTESVLDLTKYDPARFTSALERAETNGLQLRFYDTGDLPDSVIEGIWNVEKETAPDVPDYEPDITFPPFERFLQDWREYKGPRCLGIAMDGDKVVGCTTLFLPRREGKAAFTGYTGVLRAYRGKGAALAIKVLVMNHAKALGVPRGRTNNDFENPSMLAVNRNLGYELVPGPRRLVKR